MIKGKICLPFLFILNYNFTYLTIYKISKVFDKKAFVETVLNNGSLLAKGKYCLRPFNFSRGTDEKDFGKVNGNLAKDDVNAAKESWKKVKQELGKEEVVLELLTSDNALAKRNAEYIKGELEKNLNGLTVNIKPQPRKQQIELLSSSDYDIGIDVWGLIFLLLLIS